MKKKTAKMIIYCKIGAENFPHPDWISCDKQYNPIAKPVDGDTLFKYLLEDAELEYDQDIMDKLEVEYRKDKKIEDPWQKAFDDSVLLGAPKIWYMCCNEKHGFVSCDKHTELGWRWGGKPIIIIMWLYSIYKHEIISQKLFDILCKEVKFVHDNFAIHYDIRDYLIQKRDHPNQLWCKTYKSKEECDKFHGNVDKTLKKILKKKGFKLSDMESSIGVDKYSEKFFKELLDNKFFIDLNVNEEK